MMAVSKRQAGVSIEDKDIDTSGLSAAFRTSVDSLKERWETLSKREQAEALTALTEKLRDEVHADKKIPIKFRTLENLYSGGPGGRRWKTSEVIAKLVGIKESTYTYYRQIHSDNFGPELQEKFWLMIERDIPVSTVYMMISMARELARELKEQRNLSLEEAIGEVLNVTEEVHGTVANLPGQWSDKFRNQVHKKLGLPPFLRTHTKFKDSYKEATLVFGENAVRAYMASDHWDKIVSRHKHESEIPPPTTIIPPAPESAPKISGTNGYHTDLAPPPPAPPSEPVVRASRKKGKRPESRLPDPASVADLKAIRELLAVYLSRRAEELPELDRTRVMSQAKLDFNLLIDTFHSFVSHATRSSISLSQKAAKESCKAMNLQWPPLIMQLKKAHRDLSAAYHPDRKPDASPDEAKSLAEQFHAVQIHYQTVRLYLEKSRLKSEKEKTV